MEKSSAVTIVSEGKMFMDNMRYYNAGREVPDAAKKTIKGGKLTYQAEN